MNPENLLQFIMGGAKTEKPDEWPFKKRGLRSYVREGLGELSELPIFENKYYDLFNTPLDFFQNFFPEGKTHKFTSNVKGREGQYELDTKTLKKLWRQGGSPWIQSFKGYERSFAAPREFGYTLKDPSVTPSKSEMLLGNLFGAGRIALAGSEKGAGQMEAMREKFIRHSEEAPKQYEFALGHGDSIKQYLEQMVQNKEGKIPTELKPIERFLRQMSGQKTLTGSPLLSTEEEPTSNLAYKELLERIQGQMGTKESIDEFFGSATKKLDKVGDFISEMAHHVIFQDPKSYGHTRKSIIEDMMRSGTAQKGMTSKEQLAEFYDKPGEMEHTAHRVVEPRLLDWLLSQYNISQGGQGR